MHLLSCYGYIVYHKGSLINSWELCGFFFTVGNTTAVPGGIRLTLHPLGFVCYSIMLLASLFGNSVIIHIIRTDNSMKTTTNYLIINQACADLLTSIAQITGVFYYSSTDSVWIGGIVGLIFCKMYIAVLFISPIFSAWILAIIAVDRFYAVARPLRLSPISQHLKKIIFLCWVWSSAFSMDYIVKETFRNVKGYYYCDLTILFNEWSLFSTISITLNVFYASYNDDSFVHNCLPQTLVTGSTRRRK